MSEGLGSRVWFDGGSEDFVQGCIRKVGAHLSPKMRTNPDANGQPQEEYQEYHTDENEQRENNKENRKANE